MHVIGMKKKNSMPYSFFRCPILNFKISVFFFLSDVFPRRLIEVSGLNYNIMEVNVCFKDDKFKPGSTAKKILLEFGASYRWEIRLKVVIVIRRVVSR